MWNKWGLSRFEWLLTADFLRQCKVRSCAWIPRSSFGFITRVNCLVDVISSIYALKSKVGSWCSDITLPRLKVSVDRYAFGTSLWVICSRHYRTHICRWMAVDGCISIVLFTLAVPKDFLTNSAYVRLIYSEQSLSYSWQWFGVHSTGLPERSIFLNGNIVVSIDLCLIVNTEPTDQFCDKTSGILPAIVHYNEMIEGFNRMSTVKNPVPNVFF